MRVIREYHSDCVICLRHCCKAHGLTCKSCRRSGMSQQLNGEVTQVGSTGESYVVCCQGRFACNRCRNTTQVIRSHTEINQVDLWHFINIIECIHWISNYVRSRNNLQAAGLRSRHRQINTLGKNNVLRPSPRNREIYSSQIHALINVDGGISTQLDIQHTNIMCVIVSIQMERAACTCGAEVEAPTCGISIDPCSTHGTISTQTSQYSV